jgi:hypothetical protein
MRLGMWGIDADLRHRHALAPGDLVLIYLVAPERESSAAPSSPRRMRGRLTAVSDRALNVRDRIAWWARQHSPKPL